jgi:alpha-galactosidase
MITQTTPNLQLQINPENGNWHVQFDFQPELTLSSPAPVIVLRNGDLRSPISLEEHPFIIQKACRVETAHGACLEMRMTWKLDASGTEVTLIFRLMKDVPAVMMQLAVCNLSDRPLWVERLEFLRAQVDLGSSDDHLAFYANGWQSWAMTGTFSEREEAKRTRLRFIQSPLVENPGTHYHVRRGIFSSDFFGVLGSRTTRTGLLAGFLSQKEHFGSLEVRTDDPPEICLWANGDDTRLDPGVTMTTDWAVLTPISLDEMDPMGWYLTAVARENQARADSAIPAGWCSWYHFYTHVTHQDVQTNLKAITQMRDRLPLDLVQIDDGFESQVGDWFSFQPTFPNGVEPLSREIRAAGFTPGLWLAPFIVHPGAKLVKEHPEYLLRNRMGRPVNAGFIWDVFTHALDVTHPGALDYACRVVETAAHDWGFPYLKLDFIYAGALAGRRSDPTMTRAQALRRALESLRAAVGEETYLLGCGAPLGPSVGIFDAMRIGADVAGDWTPVYRNNPRIFKAEPHMPSLRNGLQNTLTRAPLHRMWWVNDPDCLMVRPDTRLTLAEVQSAAVATAMTGGSLLLSDDLPNLPEERLRLAEALLPVIGKRAQVLDWFDHLMPAHLRVDLDGAIGAWSLLALFNWTDEPSLAALTRREFHLDGEPYQYRSFWDQSTCTWVGEELCLETLPPHGVCLLAVHRKAEGQPQYIGSDLHISQGQEVIGWEWDGTVLNVRISLPRKAEGHVVISLPRIPVSARLNGQPVSIEAVGDGVYQFSVTIDGETELQVKVTPES